MALLVTVFFVAALIFLITHLFIRFLFNKPTAPLPPGPWGWPMVGALPLLGSMPHVTLAKMAKKYGPVIYLKLGTSGMVVASTPDSARAFFKTFDLNFSNRGPNAGATHMAYDSQDLVFADYGPRWKLLRRLSNLHMLGGKALEDWAHVRATELSHMLNAICEVSRRGEPVMVPEMLSSAVTNMISQVILSQRLFEVNGSDSNEFRAMVVELMTLAGKFNIGDFIPSIAWMDLQGIGRQMKKLHKKFDVLLTKMVEGHRTSSHERKGKPNFLDVLMEKCDGDDSEELNVTNVKALMLNLFTAGTDTSSSIMEWALAEILKKPNILRKAQEEMDRVIGRERRLQESDVPNLPYLQAIAKEAFRKHPSTPLNVPRIAIEACEVNGYHIPKNTRLSVNIWAIGRDPNVWENPSEFIPERFLTGKNSKMNPSGNDFELIPFGSGRRICAGNKMAVVMVEYILGTLVHSFDWRLPNGVHELNMDESYGLALQKAVPLSAMVTPRLAPTAYN